MPPHSPGIVIAFLAAASCSPPATSPAPARDRAVQAGIAKTLRTDSDAANVAAHPKLMSRRGGTLTVGGHAFVDEGDCEKGDCTRYRTDGVWQGRYVGIRANGYEDSEYFLMTPEANASWFEAIGARPEPSPSGRLFFAGEHDDRQWSPLAGAAVWECLSLSLP